MEESDDENERKKIASDRLDRQRVRRLWLEFNKRAVMCVLCAVCVRIRVRLCDSSEQTTRRPTTVTRTCVTRQVPVPIIARAAYKLLLYPKNRYTRRRALLTRTVDKLYMYTYSTYI